MYKRIIYEKGVFMKKITEIVLALSLIVSIFGGVATVVSAGDGPERKPRHGCDYDRSANEERTTGDCGGVPTPEPISIILFSAGLAGVGFAARRRLRRSE